jgi:hypothetical protein
MDPINFGLSSPSTSPVRRTPGTSLFGPSLMEGVEEEGKLLGASGGLFQHSVSFVEPSAVVELPSSASSSFTRAEGQLVGVQVLESATFGQLYCGGLIGQGKTKICIRTQCSVQGHKTRKGVMIFDGYNDGEGVLCIEVAPSVPPRKGSDHTPAFAVHASPTIAITRFPADTRVQVLTERRLVESWLEIFTGLNKLDSSVSGTEVAALAGRSQKAGMISLTPHKTAKLVKESSPMGTMVKDDEFVDVGLQELLPESLDGAGLQGSDAEAINFLRSAWPNIKTLFENLHGSVIKGRLLTKRVATQIEDELEVLDLKVVRLNTKIGERPPELGTASLFDQVCDLVVELDQVSNKVSELDDVTQHDVPSVVKSSLNEREVGFRHDLQGQLKPLAALFGVFSSKTTTPGDRFHEFNNEIQRVFRDVKTHAKEVERKVNQCTAAMAELQVDFKTAVKGLATPGNFAPASNTPSEAFSFWDQVGMSSSTTANPSFGNPVEAAPTQSSGGSMLELKELVTRIAELEERMESNRVVVAGVSFTSLSNTAALLIRFAPSPTGRALMCFCPVGLMAVATGGDSSSLSDILSFDAKAMKVGASSSIEATLSASFRQELPQFFGNLSKSVARDDRVLPALPSYDKWDTQSSRSGGRYTLSSGIGLTVDGLYHSLQNNIAGEGMEVARTMINDSRDFLNQLSSWITQTYQDLVGSGGSAKESWAYVSHCVRAIFMLLYKARAPGRGPFLDESKRQAGMVWGALQCLNVCRSLLEANFSGHPTLSHILNLHLRDNAVMNSTLDALTKRIDAMDSLAKGAKKAAEKALNGNGNGNGKGKGNG